MVASAILRRACAVNRSTIHIQRFQPSASGENASLSWPATSKGALK
jgi:hypothetical protein